MFRNIISDPGKHALSKENRAGSKWCFVFQYEFFHGCHDTGRLHFPQWELDPKLFVSGAAVFFDMSHPVAR
jgi:hypothetical protein